MRGQDDTPVCSDGKCAERSVLTGQEELDARHRKLCGCIGGLAYASCSSARSASGLTASGERDVASSPARSYRSTSWTDDQFSAPHTCPSCREAAQPIRSTSHAARKSAAKRFIGLFSFLQDGACPVSCVIYAATAAISSRPVSFQRFWVEISVKVPMDGWIRDTV